MMRSRYLLALLTLAACGGDPTGPGEPTSKWRTLSGVVGAELVTDLKPSNRFGVAGDVTLTVTCSDGSLSLYLRYPHIVSKSGAVIYEGQGNVLAWTELGDFHHLLYPGTNAEVRAMVQRLSALDSWTITFVEFGSNAPVINLFTLRGMAAAVAPALAACP